MEKFFSPKALVLGVAAAGALLASALTFAQANEQFIPALVYRSGPYAPNGVPFANGYADYLTLVNERVTEIEAGEQDEPDEIDLN